eukprot:403368054
MRQNDSNVVNGQSKLTRTLTKITNKKIKGYNTASSQSDGSNFQSQDTIIKLKKLGDILKIEPEEGSSTLNVNNNLIEISPLENSLESLLNCAKNNKITIVNQNNQRVNQKQIQNQERNSGGTNNGPQQGRLTNNSVQNQYDWTSRLSSQDTEILQSTLLRQQQQQNQNRTTQKQQQHEQQQSIGKTKQALSNKNSESDQKFLKEILDQNKSFKLQQDKLMKNNDQIQEVLQRMSKQQEEIFEQNNQTQKQNDLIIFQQNSILMQYQQLNMHMKHQQRQGSVTLRNSSRSRHRSHSKRQPSYDSKPRISVYNKESAVKKQQGYTNNKHNEQTQYQMGSKTPHKFGQYIANREKSTDLSKGRKRSRSNNKANQKQYNKPTNNNNFDKRQNNTDRETKDSKIQELKKIGDLRIQLAHNNPIKK